MRPLGILETAVYCEDVEDSADFYARVLGLQRISSREGRHVFFLCGRGVLLLFDAEATSVESEEPEGIPVPLHGARGPGHVAFAVREDELPAWRERLTSQGVSIEQEVEWPQGGRSLYFRDPAGNSVELATPGMWGLDEGDLET